MVLRGVGRTEKVHGGQALAADPRVALTVDDNFFPHQVMLVRDCTSIELLDDVVPEYELAATPTIKQLRATAQ